MKKISLPLFLLFLLISLNSDAQDYKRFKVGLHTAYVSPDEGGGGIGFTLEPGFRILDVLAVNLRLESTIFTRDFDIPETATDNIDIGVGGIGSYTLNAQFYFIDGPVRPFVGLGLGMYIPAKVEVESTVNTGGTEQTTKSSLDPDGAFGFYPRIGVDIGHFNILIDYNIVGDSEAESKVETSTVNIQGASTTNTTEKITFENSYLSIKIGATIGGGKK